MFPSEKLKTRAVELGFNLIGIIRAEPSPHLDAYLRWVEAGMHGSMGYMARPDRVLRRRDLHAILPGAQSMIVVGLDYTTTAIPPETLNDPSRGRIAAYAWGLDYHDILMLGLNRMVEWLQVESGQRMAQRVYVDTGAVLERSHAQQAGLGFIGKNTMLIHPRRGSNFFLGEILTDMEFDVYDALHRETMCGTCTRCMTACPTDAFPRPYVLDARRCISYLTIEHKGSIDPPLRPLMGNWVFGCDICQDVCPFQRFAAPSREAAFYPPDIERAAPKLVDLVALDDHAFHQRYYGTPVYRIQRERLVRNACIAAGNWGATEIVPDLKRLLQDLDPLVRSHAAWALGRILGDDARPLLRGQLQRENDASVIDELEMLLPSAN